jgi:hypothetical protein
MANPSNGRNWLRAVFAWGTIVVAGLGTGCNGDGFDPRIQLTRAPADLNILRLAQPPVLISDSVSFWAVKDQDRFVEIFYADSLGQPGERLLSFEVPRKALATYPDGTKFEDRDSVLIVVRVTDPATLAFDFEPSGLRFKSDKPARLTVGYGRAMTQPSPAEVEFGIWMQEQINEDFTRLASRVDAILSQVTADVPGFSRYAIAY